MVKKRGGEMAEENSLLTLSDYRDIRDYNEEIDRVSVRKVFLELEKKCHFYQGFNAILRRNLNLEDGSTDRRD